LSFFPVSLERTDKQSLLASEIEHVNVNEASENTSEMRLAKVLAVTFNKL
jgi:hypothetical protein